MPEVEELRVAMALNGGVSLAVWMGGCATELDRGRRAGIQPQQTPRAYDALCECFGRRLVIDILTGASAGGINGALLGAAMVSGRQLEPGFVRQRWLDLGDLSQLLHDPAEEAPTALMDGEMFHEELLSTFEAVLGTNDAAPGYVESTPPQSLPKLVPSLDVTMTDVIGVERRFRDAWGGELVAREHRPRFKFRERGHFTAPALAAAARTSAAFPIAFDPWRVDGAARVLAGLPSPTYGMDGGLLDNAPIRAALELIPSKPASSRVRRYVCYLNGDPALTSEETIGPAPTLREAGGFAINLPRVATLVDHLYAIQRAVERPARAEAIQLQLLKMDISMLGGVAEALFETYRERRTMQSLEELLTAPGDALAAKSLLEGVEGNLPWIPTDRETPGPESWRWGIRPAQRILHLLLDLLRPAIEATEPAPVRQALLGTHAAIDDQLALLGDAREEVIEAENQNNPSWFDEEAAIERLQKAADKARGRAPEAYAAVAKSVEAFRAALRDHPSCFEGEMESELFGAADGPDGQVLSNFLQRALSIEVVRRAFSDEADIDSAETLRFVQLTPAAPSPIFTSHPLSQPSPASAAQKLTGVGLGHFAGFYRRSWRANDFMWGRLDAAARVVDLLLDAPSTEVGTGSTAAPAGRVAERGAMLASALLPDARPERLRLLEEALADAGAGAVGSLEERLKAKIETELWAVEGDPVPNPMPFTRAAFQRAAQLEIVREELPIIALESRQDRKLGSSAKPLELGADDDDGELDTGVAIETVRALYKGGSSLPKQLTDPEEAVSDLGLRTLTRAAFVALSAVRNAKAPLSKYFGLVRVPLLAIAGTVAESRLYRATVAIGFWAAAIYLTSRLVTAADMPPQFSSVWNWATLTALAAAIGVVGIAAVSGVRASRGVHPFRNAMYTLALIGSGGGVAALLAVTAGDLGSLEQVLFAPGSDRPSTAALLAPLAAMGVVSAARLPLPGFLGVLATGLAKLRGKVPMCALLILGFAWLGADAGQSLVRVFDDSLWQGVSAGLALIGAPIAAIFAVTLWKGR